MLKHCDSDLSKLSSAIFQEKDSVLWDFNRNKMKEKYGNKSVLVLEIKCDGVGA
jgi:hypothetical protein